MTCARTDRDRSLRARWLAVRRSIEGAESAAGRPPGAVELVAVTKSVGPDAAAELVRLGQRDLGESRAGELERKAAALAADPAGPLPVRWHFLGSLQRNKARRVLRIAGVLHSVDSLRLLETLERIAGEEGRRPGVFLQVELTGEAQKHGIDPSELDAAIERLAAARSLEGLGLMALAPLRERAGHGAAQVFARAAELAREITADPERARAFRDRRCRLSMGMSGDFEAAVRAGSDLVRIGGALFEDAAPVGEEPA